MPKYMYYGSYTQEGLDGFLKEGGTKRREATKQLAESLGGSLVDYYFAFGENDFYAIVDMPDQASGIAASLIANSSGAVNVKTVALITPEEADEATKLHGDYRPPGQ